MPKINNHYHNSLYYEMNEEANLDRQGERPIEFGITQGMGSQRHDTSGDMYRD